MRDTNFFADDPDSDLAATDENVAKAALDVIVDRARNGLSPNEALIREAWRIKRNAVLDRKAEIDGELREIKTEAMTLVVGLLSIVNGRLDEDEFIHRPYGDLFHAPRTQEEPDR